MNCALSRFSRPRLGILIGKTAKHCDMMAHRTDIRRLRGGRSGSMLGAIIGDIAGSRFEFDNHKSKVFHFLTQDCYATDDSVMTLAVARAILDCGEDYSGLDKACVKRMQEIGRLYPDSGYGGWFRKWLFLANPEPYNSFGNGAAMRVSACGFAASSLDEARELSKKVTAVTHNHPEGIKGAEATAAAVFLARTGAGISGIKEHVHTHYYPMDFTLDSIRPSYTFTETCQDTVPQAIMAFLESSGFKDAVRNAISIGGDSDTLAAITGAIAQAHYGVPDALRRRAYGYLDSRLKGILLDFERAFPPPEPRA